MDRVQGNTTTFQTKMPGEVQAVRAVGFLYLGALAYLAKWNKLNAATAIPLGGIRLLKACCVYSNTSEIKLCQIATSAALIFCVFKRYHRALAFTYGVCIIKAGYDHFLKADPMVNRVLGKLAMISLMKILE